MQNILGDKMHKLSNQDYAKMVDSATPHGKNFINYFYAFLFGGIICAIGQGFFDLYALLGLEQNVIKMAVPVTLVFISAVLTYFRVYHKIAKLAGAGTLVPITGFANAIVSPAMEYKTEGFILGSCVKMFDIAGPVLTFATICGFIYGIIVYILGI